MDGTGKESGHVQDLEELLNRLPYLIENPHFEGWDFVLKMTREPEGGWVIRYITMNSNEWVVWAEHPRLRECALEALEQLKTAKDRARPRTKPGSFPDFGLDIRWGE